MMRLTMNLVILIIGLVLPSFLFGSSISIAWDAVDEMDLAGYRVYWGTSPDSYVHSQNVYSRTTFQLKDAKQGKKYYFTVTAYDYWGNESIYSNQVWAWAGGEPVLPTEFSLGRNYPNPFNPGTSFDLELPTESETQILIFNSVGQVVRHIINKTLDAGTHNFYWDGLDESGTTVPAGVYFIQLETDTENVIQPITLLR